MYPSIRNTPTNPATPTNESEGWQTRLRYVPATVLVLGLTSFFTDISSEMIAAVLPLYLTMQLGFTPLQYGLFDGIHQIMAGVLRPVGGLLADRWQRYKEVAVAGYGLSALSKLGLLIAGSAWLPAVGALYVDRLGKGIRTSPRDALISFATPAANLATAFGVHRTLDTGGALLGPLIAFAILSFVPGAFDAVFVSSLMFAIIGLAFITLLARNPDLVPQTVAGVGSLGTTLRAVGALLQERHFRNLVLIGGLLALLTVNDPFLYLVIQQNAELPLRYFPLLFSGTAIIYLLLAIPVGRLADRIGRTQVFVSGYGLLAASYVGLWLAPSHLGVAVACVGLLGAYYAATDGVLLAITSATTASTVRTSGIAILTTVLTVGRFVSSLTFGWLWSLLGERLTLFTFFVGLAIAITLAYLLLVKKNE